MFYTRSNGMRVPATVVGFAPDGLLHLDLHANTHILLHFSQFMLRRQKRYQPYGPWEHIPSSIWTEEEALEVDEEEEDTFLCQVCGKRDTSECSTCDLYLCRGCMDEHTCDIDVPE